MTFLQKDDNKTSKPDAITTKYITWKSSKKCFEYYDKEKKENIDLKLPLSFIPLKNVSSITGFSTENNSGIWSNEVENMKQELTVFSSKYSKTEDKNKPFVIAQGLYKDLKGDLNSKGGKFTSILYALLDGEIVRFGFSKASLGEWIDKGQALSKSPNYLGVLKIEERKQGSNKYNVPIFEKGDKLNSKDYEKAVEAGSIVDKYFSEMKEYENQYKEVKEPSEVEETAKDVFLDDDLEADPKNNLPF